MYGTCSTQKGAKSAHEVDKSAQAILFLNRVSRLRIVLCRKNSHPMTDQKKKFFVNKIKTERVTSKDRKPL